MLRRLKRPLFANVKGGQQRDIKRVGYVFVGRMAAGTRLTIDVTMQLHYHRFINRYCKKYS